ncbi:flavodoxin family protein [Bosea caraganae]|uniref:Flavodoxin family protein n=1 Tax=Bosea caraganae TaxID=2763117 RepID=A0A370LBI6_9HYPH|nr:NAD(P)H-dependent oxidoreductase [Bosea caraganae]RDJ27300.1 flavodoxin family protein [Bosea caraganae]RDJ29316.1 flavodoxin family protein [Bosea caraganae]
MNVFIVHAHPEPRSLNGALTATAKACLTAAGHEVMVSDLYAMGWQARSDRSNFLTEADPAYFKQQDEEVFATGQNGFAPDIRQELDKLFGCDVLILQFPLWWFGMPALMKGWVDRVFAMGTVYGAGAWYDRGKLRGRRAMVSVTIGGAASMYAPDGINGDTDKLLFPIQNGMLRFTGFDVLPPFIAWQPARISEGERQGYLRAYERRLLTLDATEPLRFPPLTAYDPETFRLLAPAEA